MLIRVILFTSINRSDFFSMHFILVLSALFPPLLHVLWNALANWIIQSPSAQLSWIIIMSFRGGSFETLVITRLTSNVKEGAFE